MSDPATEPAASGQSPSLRAVDKPEQSGWGRHKWLILTAICVAQFMVVLDIAVVNVALPSIKNDLHFTNESLQWVLTAYAIFFGGFLLLGGRLSDLIGRRRVFMTGLVIFSAASLMCGLAWSEASLIVFRAIQGFGGAMLSPAALSILVTTFAEGRERNLALGIWGGIAGSGAAAGTLLGGVLTSYAGWQWIFYINVPIGAALVACSPFLLARERGRGLSQGTDVAGAITVTAGLMILVYALTRATQIGWSAGETITLLVISAALLVAFVAIELRSRTPILPLRVLRLRTPAAANVVGFLIGAAIFSQFFLLSLYMQQVLGYSAFRTGLAYIAVTATTVVFAVVAQAMVTRLGARLVLSVGMLFVAVALVLFTQISVHGSYASDLLPGFLIGGIGLALAFVPVSIAALTGVRPDEAGAASGLINTSQQIGGAVGLAAITTIATTATTNYLTSHAPSPAVLPSALTHGFQVGFVVLAGLALLAAVLSATLIANVKASAMAGEGAEGAGGEAAAASVASSEGAGSPAARRPAPRPVHVLGLVASESARTPRSIMAEAEPGSRSDGEPVGAPVSLFRTAQAVAPEGMTLTEFDIGSLPGFDSSGDGREAAHAERLSRAIDQAGALLFVTPACGAGLSPELANAVEWTSHPQVRERLAGKPVAIMGATSTSEDTEACELQVGDSLRLRDAHVVSGPDVRVSDAERQTGDDGLLTGSHVRSSVSELLARLMEQAEAA